MPGMMTARRLQVTKSEFSRQVQKGTRPAACNAILIKSSFIANDTTLSSNACSESAVTFLLQYQQNTQRKDLNL